MPDTNSDNPTQRAITVFENLVTNGPQTLNQLNARIDTISRTALHRALSHLRSCGWIRMRHGDNAWCLTQKPSRLLAGAPTASVLPEEVDAFLGDLPKGCDIAISTFVGAGEFEQLEASANLTRLGTISLVTSPAALITLAHLDRQTAVEHITKWLPNASPKERKFVQTGRMTKTLDAWRGQPFVLNKTGQGAVVVIQSSDKNMGSVELSLRKAAQPDFLKSWLTGRVRAVFGNSLAS